MTRDTIRAFVALELPEVVKDFLQQSAESLKQSGADVSWVKPAAMHLTLKFLGETSTKIIDPMAQKLQFICSKLPSLTFRIKGLGCFPNPEKPRVIWAGCDGDVKALQGAVAEIELALVPFGFPKEKRSFSPHLTLGRIRSGKNVQSLKESIRKNVEVSGPQFSVNNAVFFQSVLKPTGAQYKMLHQFPFMA